MTEKTNNDQSVNKMDQVFDKLLAVAAKFGNNRQLSNLRDGFATFMPFVIMGSLALMFSSVIIQPNSILADWCGAEEGNALYDGWSTFSFFVNPLFQGLTDATTNFMAIYLSFFFGYYTLRSYGDDKPIFGGAISLAAFLLFRPVAAAGGATTFLGTGGLIMAIVTGLTASTLYFKLSKIEALKIKMPDGVPPAVGNAFGALLSVFITLACFGAVQPIWGAIMYAAGPGKAGDLVVNPEYYYIFNAINTYLAVPFQGLTDTIWAVFIICLFVDIFWFLGLHGSNIMNPVILTAWMPGLIGNMDAVSTHGSVQAAIDAGADLSTWNGATFAAFCLVGGGGYCAALTLPMSVLSKNPASKAVARLSLPPSVFNISEPMVYGIPLMLNVVYMVPFLFIMPTIGSLTFLVTSLGLMYPATVYPAWIMPGIVLGPLLSTTDWRAAIWSVIFLIAAIAMYAPWILLDNKLTAKEKAAEAGISVQEWKKLNEQELATQKEENKKLKAENKEAKQKAREENKKLKAENKENK